MVKHNFNDPGRRRGHRPRGVSDGLFRKSEVEYDDADAAGRRKVNAQSAAWTPRNQSVDPDKELYRKVCKQRELERKVRKSKTEADMLEAAGDTEGAKEVRRRMTEQNKALRSYCEDNGLKYRSDRVRTYGAIAPKKALDKSAESGIIKSGSDAVALEYQRYGRNKTTLVNKTYIDGGEYRRKFDSVSNNVEVNKSVYNCAKSALKHRSGTVYEDMYWIDSETGSIIASEINSTTQQKIVYSGATKKLVSSYEKGKIVTIHTHPNSMPPSVADFNSCFRNGYKQGYVACHDGKVFAYTSEQEVSEELYSLYISSYISEGLSEYEAQIKTLEKLKENHLIDFWEVT